jgi:hypothetical protein
MENWPFELVIVLLFATETVAALRGVSLSFTKPFRIPSWPKEYEITNVKKTKVRHPRINIFFKGGNLIVNFKTLNDFSIQLKSVSYKAFGPVSCPFMKKIKKLLTSPEFYSHSPYMSDL